MTESTDEMKPHAHLGYRALFLSSNALLFYLALVKFLLHAATNLSGGYGYFRDEFYYVACSDHLAWGYVDQPPLSIAILWISRVLFGDSLFAIRLLPAVSGAAVVALAGLITRELGGKRFAQTLAATSVIIAPLTLGMNSYYSMNSFDMLFWTLAIYLIVILLKGGAQKHWILLGAVLGLGLLNKISVLWLGAGLAAGLLTTSNRRLFLAPGVWIAGVISLLLFLPYMLWQVVHDFPTLEFIRNATANKYSAVSPLEMIFQQSLNMNPMTFLLWVPGVVFFLVSKSVRSFRILPIIYLTVLLILSVNKSSKSEYLGPLFPMLFAMGAFTIERFIHKFNWRWLRPVTLALLLFSGIALAPFAIAVLPVETYIAYSEALGLAPSTPEKKELNKLPQFYADMFGWENMVKMVADAYNTLTPEEKAKCAIIGNNYGEAGAIDFLGPQYGLPKAISGHNNYWLWGPRDADGSIVIRLGGTAETLRESYAEVRLVSVIKDDYSMPYENNMPVWICTNRRVSLQEDWAQFRHYE